MRENLKQFKILDCYIYFLRGYDLVAKAVNRFDEGTRIAQLLPEALDVCVHGSCVELAFITPNFLKQCVSALQPAWSLS